MVVIHGKPKRKSTGGRFTNTQTKRLNQRGSHPTHTKIGTEHKKAVPKKGGGFKERVLTAAKANLYDSKTKTYSIAEIKTVDGNEADRHFVRHNILTKGAIITTSKGKAKVTNRPGQEGNINATLVE